MSFKNLAQHSFGPLITVASCTALLVPHLISSSTHTLLSLTALALGLLLTASDALSTVRRKSEAFVLWMLREKLSCLVLDNFLRSMFSAESSILGYLLAAFIGTAGMYNLPLNESQRVRIFRHALGLRNEEDAGNILLSTGGFVELVPDFWRKVFKLDQNIEGVGGGNEEGKDEAKAFEAHGCTDTRVHINDMSWDVDVDTRSTVGSTSDILNESAHYVRGDDSSGVALPQTATGIIYPEINPLSEGYLSSAVLCRGKEGSSNESNDAEISESRGSEDVLRSIFFELIADIGHQMFSHVDENAVRKVGISAAAMLCVQLRASKMSRCVFSGFLHGCTTMGLVGSAIAAMIVLATKRHLLLTGTPANVTRRTTSYNQGHFLDATLCSRRFFRNMHFLPITAFRVRSILLKNKPLFYRMQALVAFYVLFRFGRERRRERSRY